MVKWFNRPGWLDVLVLWVFAILILYYPYFASKEFNLFEIGLYLPGIEAIHRGDVPFRDFFHLRGPFEVYMPAFLMNVFGNHMAVINAYFYAGNVLCILFGILIAKELFQTRWMLYAFVPTFIGRAFPRVAFPYWGGMRYAWGMIAVWMVIKFFKTRRLMWLGASGVVTMTALFTSVEMGVYVAMGFGVSWLVALIFKAFRIKEGFVALGAFIGGCALVAVPFLLYMISQNALAPYIESTLTIVLDMQKVIDPHLVSEYPRNLIEALHAMLNPVHTNFKHLTPAYVYITLLGYLIVRWRKGVWGMTEQALLFLGVYGFIMYNTGFRGLWAQQFEMALMPEKILYFFLLEVFALQLWSLRADALQRLASGVTAKAEQVWLKRRIIAARVFVVFLIVFSTAYGIRRFDRRFVAFDIYKDALRGQWDLTKHHPLVNEETMIMTIDRMKGLTVRKEKGENVETVVRYLQTHLDPDEPFITYPEIGVLHYLTGRPFTGRFPIATFAWFNDKWQREFMIDLKDEPPKYFVLQKKMPVNWKEVYLGQPANLVKHTEVMTFLQEQYSVEFETEWYAIYRNTQL